jgi:tetratricopeptide (TPR) repeat protein
VKIRILTAVAVLFALMLWPARAETAPAAHPWDKAETLLTGVSDDFQSSGFAGVQRHIEEIEQALAEADAAFDTTKSPGGPIYVLTDGMTESLMAMAAAGAAAEKDPALRDREIVAVNNPYPGLALLLGSFYNEAGRYGDAARVLEKGMSLVAMRELGMGEHLPYLATEHALALAELGKLDEALAAYDAALKLVAIDDKGKARAQRGRGYVLTDLGRLDEAEAAYNESLKLDPGNRIALHELDYIKKLRAGGDKLPSQIVAPNAPNPPIAPNAPDTTAAPESQ